VLSRIFTIAIDNGMNIQNPCRKVRLLRMDNQRNRYLSDEEETRLMATLVGRRAHLRPVVILAIHTGMRRGEILSLRWNQIDFERSLILVQRTKTDRDRIIPMNSTVRKTLDVIRQQAEGDQVFPINDVKRSFSYACVKAKIADFRFHELRHTAATRLADRGADAFQIAAILGHSSIQMTARYTHATSAGLRRAMESLAVDDKQVGKISPHNFPTICGGRTRGERANCGTSKVSFLKYGAGDGDRTRITSLGIKTTAPLFSQPTKPLSKNQRACNAYRACRA
jgi:integrase